MTKEKRTALTVKHVSSAPPVEGEGEPMSVQTVKVTRAELIRLKIYSANSGRKHQDILHSALVEYLDKHAPVRVPFATSGTITL